MASIQVRNIPDNLYERLYKHAHESNSTMRALVVAAIERELRRREWQQGLADRPVTDLGIDAATLLAEARAEREAEMDERLRH